MNFNILNNISVKSNCEDECDVALKELKHEKFITNYAPNFEEVDKAYWFRVVRASVYASIRSSRTVHARALKFHVWIPHGIIADRYFFLVWVISLSGVMPLWKNQNEILSARYEGHFRSNITMSVTSLCVIHFSKSIPHFVWLYVTDKMVKCETKMQVELEDNHLYIW